MRWIIPLALWLASCGGGARLEFVVTPEDEAAMAAFVAHLQDDRVTLRVAADPLLAPRRAGWSVALIPDDSCGDCYVLTAERRAVIVGGGGVLGRQYGAADVLEQLGYRFHHPFEAVRPARLGALDPERLGVAHSPEIARRGLHLHTLHPIEGLYDFWLPGEAHRERAAAVIDWVVKNRGNHLQWVSLDDIMDDEVHAAWREHTRAIHDEAHRRGIDVGVGVQLFGSGNLQNAYDLLDRVGTEAEQRAELGERAERLLGGLEWDLVNLSFGEFFAEAPEDFIASADLAVDELLAAAPEAELASVIHVGDDLRVAWDDQELIYYFLATYADERLVPWVHTVMYLNLVDPALGAYHHADFSEHRALLHERVLAGEPVGYFPESAYWVAFDNPVPTFLPLYVHSRWLDLADLDESVGAPLPAHVLFSSGWEWGYWQTDVATLRMSYERPDAPLDLYRDMFAPWPEGEAIAALLDATAATQREWLIGRGLSAYLAGIDVVMELGYTRDIISQPRRPAFSEVTRYDAAELDAFAGTLEDLDGMAMAFDALAARAEALDTGDRWVAEIADGLRVTALRAAFAHRVYAAAAAREVAEAEAQLAEAEALLAAARPIVDRRHADLHDPDGERLLVEGANPTVYQYGYLIRAEELCFWTRDLVQARNASLGEAVAPPGCAI